MKKALIILPELSNTGAPNSGYNMSLALRKIGLHPIVISKSDGLMRKRFDEAGIPIYLSNRVDDYIMWAKQVDICIINTSMLYEIALETQKYVYTILIIREARSIGEFADIFKCSLDRIAQVENVLTVSEYARAEVKNILGIDSRVLHNFVPDLSYLKKQSLIKGEETIVRFGILGTIEPRKGIEVCVNAFAMCKYEKKMKLVVAGRLLDWQTEYWEKVLSKIDILDNVTYFGEINTIAEKVDFYNNVDVIIVASEDESCSLVALEAASMGKFLILSQNVGAKYIIGKINGFIFKTGNENDLYENLKKIYYMRHIIRFVGNFSRIKYKKYASEKHYIDELKNIVDKIK